MDNDIQISVIINSYNYGHYVEAAIVSALQQTLSRNYYEIIVVDDGSTDDTRQRVANYSPNVIYHFQDNGGQAVAINTGLAFARGKYVAFLDADDYWHPDKLKDVLTSFSGDSSVDVVYHALMLVDETNQMRGVTPPSIGSAISGKPIENDMHHLTSIGGATSGIAWRISALRRLLPIPESYRICADSYLMICAPLAARKFVLLDTPLGFYRIHGENRYAELVLAASAVHAKSPGLASYYRRLCLNDLIKLSASLNCQEMGMVRELNAVCFADRLLAIKSRSGTMKALREFCTAKNELADLPLTLRCFRSATIILQLFVSPQIYSSLQTICANSQLWHFVQRHIKNDSRFMVQHLNQSGEINLT